MVAKNELLLENVYLGFGDDIYNHSNGIFSHYSLSAVGLLFKLFIVRGRWECDVSIMA